MIYSYICECGEKKEENSPMGQSQPVTCTCGKQMQKEIGIPTINFVGEGWTRG